LAGSSTARIVRPLQTESRGEAHEPPSSGARVVTLVGVILPPLGLFAAAWLLWGGGFNLSMLLLFVGMYALSAVGVTVGFHRLFAHRSFEACRAVQLLLGVLGSLAMQGPLFRWVALHRRHHQHSDRQEDPHSPHRHGGGAAGALRGLWHAHVGWLFAPDPPGLSRYVADLRRSVLLRAVNALFPVWALAGLLAPALAAGLLLRRWEGVLLGFLWGGLVRVFFVHHVTWSVNSVCHLWGSRPYRSGDQSRDNALLGVLALGEGWHNTHHAFPTSARHGLRWWQPDASYGVIRGLALLGLAWDVKLPTRQAQLRGRRGGGGE
jgi:stearoyl-CoA desaturase (delta-9 desaturase)